MNDNEDETCLNSKCCNEDEESSSSSKLLKTGHHIKPFMKDYRPYELGLYPNRYVWIWIDFNSFCFHSLNSLNSLTEY
jgi:hypothetical protein